MGISYETLAASRKYTDDSLKGVGALAGKPCQIQSITPITGGNRVTFLWVDDNSDSHTSTMDVMNGAQGDPGDPGAPGDPGQDGVGIKSLAINSSNHLIVTLTDDNTVDAGEIPAVQSDWNQSDSSASDFIKNKPTLGTAAAKNSTDAVTEDSTDLVESGAVFTGLTVKANKTDVATDIQKVYNVMGQNGAKNLFDINSSQIATSGTLTATVGENGSITIDGTGTAAFALPNLASGNFNGKVYDLKPSTKYVISYGIAQTNALKLQAFSKATADGSWTKFAESTDANSLEFTTPASFNDLWVRVLLDAGTAVSSLTFYPMIRLAADTDTTYQPYAPTNAKLNEEKMSYADNGILGAKNLLYHGGTQTTQGVEFAGNPGDVLTVTRTSSSDSHAYYNKGKFTLKPGTYIFSNGYNSLPSGIQATYLYNHTDSAYFINCNNGPKVFTLTAEKTLAFNIEVQKTQSPSGVKIYPMIRRVTDTDTAFQPYAMTNQELTKVDVADVNISIQTSELAQKRVRKCGKIVECTISLQVNEAVTAWTDFATIPEGFRPSTYIQAVNNKTIYTGYAVLQIAPNGGIQSAVNLAVGDRVRFTAVWICP